ncbi:MAG: hypothetical protein QW734_11185, partial [Candidatus Bathyarchaeia archaeon]
RCAACGAGDRSAWFWGGMVGTAAVHSGGVGPDSGSASGGRDPRRRPIAAFSPYRGASSDIPSAFTMHCFMLYFVSLMAARRLAGGVLLPIMARSEWMRACIVRGDCCTHRV